MRVVVGGASLQEIFQEWGNDHCYMQLLCRACNGLFKSYSDHQCYVGLTCCLISQLREPNDGFALESHALLPHPQSMRLLKAPCACMILQTNFGVRLGIEGLFASTFETDYSQESTSFEP